MNLDRDNLKKIRGLILFTIFVLVALWNYELVFNGIKFVWGVISPFVLGGVIAFIVNIPMRFFEEKLFDKAKVKKNILAKTVQHTYLHHKRVHEKQTLLNLTRGFKGLTLFTKTIFQKSRAVALQVEYVAVYTLFLVAKSNQALTYCVNTPKWKKKSKTLTL